MTQENETVWLGIDWADEKHRWAMRILGETRTQHGELEHTPEAVDEFISSLAIRFPGQRVAVALEQSRGALIFMLGKYEHLILYPIHPNTLDHYRKSVYPSGAKSDPADATLILEFLCKHSERLRPFHPDTEETRTLQLLVEARREAVDDKTRYLNRLTAQLKMFFPQMLYWFSTIDTVVVGRLLKKWPTLEILQAAPAAEVADFLSEISQMYLRGDGVKQDYGEAYFWMSLAQRQTYTAEKYTAVTANAASHLTPEQKEELQKRIAGELTANNPIPYTSPEPVFPAVAGHPEKRSDEGPALAFS